MTTTQSEITEERLGEGVWLVTAGPDGEVSQIVIGFEAMKNAVVRCIWDGLPESEPDDAKQMREEMDDPDFWSGDFWSCAWDFEDGYLRVQRVTDASALSTLTRRSSAGVVKPDIRAALKRAEAYAAEYEFDSDEGCHTPSDLERVLMIDMLNGLFDDEAFFATLSPQEPVTGEAVAYEYELATMHFSGGYDNWEPRLTKHPPHTPPGSFRNLRPLYPHPAPSPLPAAEGDDVLRKAMACDAWPMWLANVVERTNEASDAADMSTEQAVAFGILTAFASPSTGVDDAMVERAAKAIAENHWSVDSDFVKAVHVNRTWQHHADDARAALLSAHGEK